MMPEKCVNSTEEKIKVMQAFLNGKPIVSQYKRDTFKGWIDVPEPNWDWHHKTYKVKEPKYRCLSIKEVKEMLPNELENHDEWKSIYGFTKVRHIETDTTHFITGVSYYPTFNVILRRSYNVNLSDVSVVKLLKEYVFLDNTPCGVKIEE